MDSTLAAGSDRDVRFTPSSALRNINQYQISTVITALYTILLICINVLNMQGNQSEMGYISNICHDLGSAVSSVQSASLCFLSKTASYTLRPPPLGTEAAWHNHQLQLPQFKV